KMTRLDDAGVNGADGHLVDLFAFDTEVIGHARFDRRGRRALPCVALRVRAMEANGLEPRMILRPDAPLLGNFTFKPVRLRAGWRQRRVGLLNGCRCDAETSLIGAREQHKELDRAGAVANRPAKER